MPRGKTHPQIHEVEVRAAPTAAAVYRAILVEGESELGRAFGALALSGLAAGLSMGFSFLTETLLSHYLPEAHWTPAVTKFGYSVGFLVVILGRQQLFTENTVTPVFPLFQKVTVGKAVDVARLMAIVLAFNVIGASLFALIAYAVQPWQPEMSTELSKDAEHAMEPYALRHFTGAIFAGWIIALLVWTLPFAGNNRVALIIILTYLIGLGNFSHVIAGSVEAAYAVFAGVINLSEALFQFFLPTLLGNLIGGVAFVAAINHGQAGTTEEQAIGEGQTPKRPGGTV